MNKQLVCRGANMLDIVPGDIPPTPKFGVIVKVLYCGICHSDAHVYGNGAWDPRLLPKVLGHEISGIIYDKGTEANSDINIGDNILVYPYGGCRKCDYCKAGSVDCINKYNPVAHSYGIWKDGGYQQYIAIEDMWCIVPVPKNIPMDVASTVSCAGITAWNAVEHCKQSIDNAIHIKGKANIVIVGTGGLGTWGIQILKALYDSKVYIVAIDIKKEKLNEAISSGADTTFCWSKLGTAKEIADNIKESLNGELVDAAIDFVGSSNTIERVFHCLNFGSTLMIVGLYKCSLPDLNTVDIIIKHIKLQGIYSGSRGQVFEVLDLIATKKISGPVINHVTLKDVGNILAAMNNGIAQNGRSCVRM